MTSVGSVTQYIIDREDRVSWVGDAWLDFARANGASELTAERVMGRSLWGFIASPEVRQLYRALIERVRASQRPVSLPFRCDSPDCARYMTLRIAADLDETVHFAARLDREVFRDPIMLLDPGAPRSSETLPICSVCKAVQTSGFKWMDLEEAAKELELLAQPVLPRLTHGICPECGPGLGAPSHHNHV